MKKIIILIIGIVVLFITLILLYFSPLGTLFLKNYVKEKLCFTNRFKISYFNHSINSFSMTLNNKDGYIQIVGTLVPFNASYNANFNNIETFFKFLKGGFDSTGEIIYNKNFSKLNGNYIYAKGYGKFELSCNKNKISGIIVGNNFNTKLLLQNIKDFTFPIFHKIPIIGHNNLKITLSNSYKLKANFIGNMNINNIIFPIKSNIHMNFFTLNDFRFNVNVFSSKLNGQIIGMKDKHNLALIGKLNTFDLSLIRKEILYPLRGKLKLNFKFNKPSNIFNFSSKFFSGYSDGKNINIQLNLSLHKFFNFVNIPQILTGNISGNVVINKYKGYFNFLIENATFLPNKIIQKLEKITHIRLENKKSIFFLNGKFDNQKVIFDFISKNPNYYIYLTKGIYYYDGFYKVSFDLKTKNNFYKINIINNKIQVLKHIYNGTKYKTLVF